MTEDELACFHDSLERCTATPEFLDRFYECFVASSPAVAEKFASTDFAKQKRSLKASLYMLMIANEGNAGGQMYLDHLAKRHSRQELDIQPEMYNLWLDCLLAAIRDCDPRWSPEIEQAWRSMVQPGIAYLKAKYLWC